MFLNLKMCGIFCVFGNISKFSIQSALLNHRGPDANGSYKSDNLYMEFFRLAINDLTSRGMQPFARDDKVFICNGEMYNHKDYGGNDHTSDCLTMFKLILKNGVYSTCRAVKDSEFAFCYYDGAHLFVARDPIGVRPLFYTMLDNDTIAFASEIKSLNQFNTRIEIFPPGHMYCSFTKAFTCYAPLFWTPPARREPNRLKISLINSVDRRVDNSNRDVGFLLSGGLDSSLVVSIACNLLEPPQRSRIRTFTIGVEDSPDAVAAQKVASYLGTTHTHYPFDFQEGVDVLRDVIQSLESYDTTTIRASVPMWLLCRNIKRDTPCRVILSGEGSDELLGGYKYFKNAPSVDSFLYETFRRIRLLHQFDVLRADRCTSAHGLELRAPFLDDSFVQAVMDIDPSLKMTQVEKKVLREQFRGFLPEEILWRTKDAFSDAVGYNWVDFIKNHAETVVSDETFAQTVQQAGTHNPPLTKEEALYRQIFWSLFGRDKDHLISEIWRPKWTNVVDPSARHIK